MSRLGSRTRRRANFKAKIQDMKGGQMSRPRYKIWKGVNVKADIQDKDGAVKRGQHQSQSQDTGQEEVPMSKLRFRTSKRSSNSIESTNTFCDQFSR
jgi:hypothetical protein